MERIYSTELGKHIGERVRLAGWLHRFRQQSKISFLVLRDAVGTAQIIVQDPQIVSLLAGLYNESVIEVEGTIVAEAQAPGGVEVHEPEARVISAASEAPPIDIFRPTLNVQLPTMLDHAALTLRHPRNRSIWRLSAASMEGFRWGLKRRGFVEIQTPKIVGASTESGANVFRLEYFDKHAYLAQSPQLYKQIMVGAFERVFEVGPVFRAEPHDTQRHLNEYVSLDAEMGFIEDHTTVMRMLTEVIGEMLAAVSKEAALVSQLGIGVPQAPATIPAIHFSEAKEIYLKGTGEDTTEEPDLSPAEERWLGEWAQAEHGSEFLFVTGFPMSKRPFYTHADPQRPEYSNSFDLLFRGMEIVTGGQRLHRYEDYLTGLSERGLDPEPLSGYLEAFKYGMPPHGGFAIGLERWMARLTGINNVRETALFPRDTARLTP